MNERRAKRGRSEGRLYQRADGLWVGSVSLGFSPQDKRIRKNVYGKTKREAQEKLQKLLTKTEASADAEKLTVAQYLADWLAIVKPTVVSPWPLCSP